MDLDFTKRSVEVSESQKKAVFRPSPSLHLPFEMQTAAEARWPGDRRTDGLTGGALHWNWDPSTACRLWS
jgi:hypothetical protein